MLRDLRLGLRTLLKEPGFSFIAVLTLALGIGASTAIFSLLDRVLLRPLPVAAPEQLTLLDWTGAVDAADAGTHVISYPMYTGLREGTDVFTGLAARNREWMGVRYNGVSERVLGEFVSGNYFDVLGIGATIGRVFSPHDDVTPGGHPLVVLSYEFWTTRFHQDPGVLGSTVFVNGAPFTVIGVGHASFDGIDLGAPSKFWIPVTMRNAVTQPAWAAMFGLANDGRWLHVIGRLKPGISMARAKVALQPLFHAVLERDLDRARAQHALLFTRREDALRASLQLLPAAELGSGLREDYGPALRVLMALVGLVFLIACANVANLLLARAAGREREMAARLALGAGRGRLIRQSLVESALLALAGSAAGLPIAMWCDAALIRMIPIQQNVEGLSAAPDLRVLGFTFFIAMAAAAMFGIAPALRAARIDLISALKENASTASPAHARFRQTLASAQVFLSTLLLIGAGLFARSLANLASVDPGYGAANLLSFEVNPGLNGYSPQRTRQVIDEILERVRATAGVQSAACSVIQMLEDWWESPMTIEGYQAKPGAPPVAVSNGISPGYFATLGIRIVDGRDFTSADVSAKRKLALVNESFARRFFPGRSPLGLHVGYGADPGTKAEIEIIGVVTDSKYDGNLGSPALPEVFVTMGQLDVLNATYYIRTAARPESMFSALRSSVARVDPNIAVFGAITMSEQLRNHLAAHRMLAMLAWVAGALAALLAAVGLYGLLTFNVVRRRREFGIRTALGARRAQIVGLIVRDVLLTAGLGIAVAIPAGWGSMRLVRSQLYGIGSADPISFLGAVGLLAIVAMIAGAVPAWRATRIDPVEALRHE